MNLNSAIAKLNPIPVKPMDKTNIAKMREWVSKHGQCIRQLTVRQQRTKFSASTLPMSACVGYKATNVGRKSLKKRKRKSSKSMTLTLIPIYLCLDYLRMRR